MYELGKSETVNRGMCELGISEAVNRGVYELGTSETVNRGMCELGISEAVNKGVCELGTSKQSAGVCVNWVHLKQANICNLGKSKMGNTCLSVKSTPV